MPIQFTENKSRSSLAVASTTRSARVTVTGLSAARVAVVGLQEATASEVTAGTNHNRYISPYNLTYYLNNVTSFDIMKQPATTTYSGVVELATNAEAIAGSNTDVAVTPSALTAALAAETLLIANNLDDVGTAATAFNNIKQAATTTYNGVVELATDAEAIAGSNTQLAVTPAALAAAIAAIPGGSFFSSDAWVNVIDFNAVPQSEGDAAANTAAVQDAIDTVSARGGGIVFFPDLFYVDDTITVPDYVTLLGAVGGLGTRADVTVLQVDGSWAQVINMGIIGKGSNNDTGTFGATAPAVVMNGVSSRMSHCAIGGGSPGLQCSIDDVYIEDTSVRETFSDLVLLQAVTFCIRCKFDHQWPVSVPAIGSSYGAWASTTGYSVGDVVLHPDNYYIQCSTTGTSGGSAPTLLNYGRNITDDSVVWQLASPENMNGIAITGNECHVFQSDFTGCYGRCAIKLDGCIKVYFQGCIASQAVQESIRIVDSDTISFDQMEITPALSGSTVRFEGDWGTNATISNSMIAGDGIGIGVAIEGGTAVKIIGCDIFSLDTGISVTSNVEDFIITNNNIHNCDDAVIVGIGTSNHYVISQNIVKHSTAGVTDGGIGVDKSVTANV